ncbi:MAG: ATP-binding protein [Gemmatimonadaceae bacterium]
MTKANFTVGARRRFSFVLAPESWRADLLGMVLRVTTVFGAVAYVPSAYSAIKFGMTGVFVMDTVALLVMIALSLFNRIPHRVRAICTCLVFYVLGAGLLIGVGSISQIYLFGFSLLTTLLLSIRWGLRTVALNAVTMLAVGYIGIAAPEMVVPHWATNFLGWCVVTVNFVFLNTSLVLTLGAVIAALEHALGRSHSAREALEHERKELVKLNSSLEQNRALFRIAGITARLGGWRVELGSNHVMWSDEVCELHEVPAGYSPTLVEVFNFYLPEWRDVVKAAFEGCGRDGTPFDVEAQLVTAKGTRLWMRVIGNALRNDVGSITHVHGSAQDVTPGKVAQALHAKLEEQFRQAQKMETIGSLAGGIAHDFNNLMSVVLGYSELLVADLKPGDPLRADIEEIRNAGLRAADLTRQLLAFSRQQVLKPSIVDLAEVVGGMENMLRRLIGDSVELVTVCAPSVGRICIDRGQIEQVIMNLAVNGRDAMPSGGVITIETAEVLLDEDYASEHVGVSPGPHVMLAVSDSGSGIDEETQSRMFEPFFTTKELGKGTGLGLATVFGIVQQSGGTIWVYSELGEGTSFKLYFPIVANALVAAAAANVDSHNTKSLQGLETILLVEDDASVLQLARTILRRRGYNVLEAQNGGEALLLCEQYFAPIHLLLTDVVMPRMSGRQLAERLQLLRPTMKALFMSGYVDDIMVRHHLVDATVAYVQKPFSPDSLAQKVREVLGVQRERAV